jgi:hypothetical protein
MGRVAGSTVASPAPFRIRLRECAMPDRPAPVFFASAARRAADDPDPAEIAVDGVELVIARAEFMRVSPPETLALAVLEGVARLVAYGFADLPPILNALAEAVPARAQMLRDANGSEDDPPPLSAFRFALAPAACRVN